MRRGLKRTKTRAQGGPRQRSGTRTPSPDAASRAGLRHVSYADPGIRRVRAGRGFAYRNVDGTPVRQPSELARFRSLAIPPAWRDVDITAKDVRTWFGTVLTARGLAAVDAPSSNAAANREIARVISDTAAALGNTRAVCRRCYVHPAVLDAFRDGTLRSAFDASEAGNGEGLDLDERAVVRLLPRRVARRTSIHPEW